MAKVYQDRWKRGASIGAGGQAEIFHVQDMNDPDTPYALKRLRNPERIDRFEREVAALAKLDHLSIIRVIDHFVEDDTACYVMPLMEGGNLERRVESCSGDIQRSLKLILAMSDAVQAAHAAGVIHRDLKPENILFRNDADDAPVVSDFGVCHLLGMKRLTSTSEAVGARYFMAPELEGGRSNQIGSHNDVYSLGKLLYYIVSGGTRLPRERHRDSGYELRQRLTGDSLVSVKSCQLEYVSRLLDHMIAEGVSERWGTVDGCADMIRTVQRLVAEGRYPFTHHMPCRVCGLGESFITPQKKRRAPGDPAKPWLMCCRLCGHEDQFHHTYFQENDSITKPPQDLLWEK